MQDDYNVAQRDQDEEGLLRAATSLVDNRIQAAEAQVAGEIDLVEDLNERYDYMLALIFESDVAMHMMDAVVLIAGGAIAKNEGRDHLNRYKVALSDMPPLD